MPRDQGILRALRALKLASVLAFLPLYSQLAKGADPTPNPTFANYGFASELGSGVYSIGGRTVQIYQIPLKFAFREASPQGAAPGINFVVPLTLGFFNFQTQDVAQLKVPNQIGELSVEPGVELDYWLSNVWHVYPYAKGGGAFASSSASDALIYDIGVRSDYDFQGRGGNGLYRADLTHAGVHYTSELPRAFRVTTRLPACVTRWSGGVLLCPVSASAIASLVRSPAGGSE